MHHLCKAKQLNFCAFKSKQSYVYPANFFIPINGGFSDMCCLISHDS